jgi:hypothetical protein
VNKGRALNMTVDVRKQGSTIKVGRAAFIRNPVSVDSQAVVNLVRRRASGLPDNVYLLYRDESDVGRTKP